MLKELHILGSLKPIGLRGPASLVAAEICARVPRASDEVAESVEREDAAPKPAAWQQNPPFGVQGSLLLCLRVIRFGPGLGL